MLWTTPSGVEVNCAGTGTSAPKRSPSNAGGITNQSGPAPGFERTNSKRGTMIACTGREFSLSGSSLTSANVPREDHVRSRELNQLSSTKYERQSALIALRRVTPSLWRNVSWRKVKSLPGVFPRSNPMTLGPSDRRRNRFRSCARSKPRPA